MNDDLSIFTEKLKELKTKKKLNRDIIKEHFAGMELGQDQIDKIIIYLKNSGSSIEASPGGENKVFGNKEYDLYDLSLPSGVIKDDSIRSVLDQLKMYPPLRAESEKELVRDYLQGNEEAGKALTQAGMRLVLCVARDIYKSYNNLDFSEILQEGMAGLYKTLPLLRESADNTFSDTAAYSIRESIMEWVLAAEKEADGTGDIVNTLNRIKDAFDELSRDLGYEPGAQEIADHLEIPESRVIELCEFSGFTVRI